MTTEPARSLRTGTTHRTRWYPVDIDTWRETLAAAEANGIKLIEDHDIRSNLAYNLQYLEYLEQTLIELSLSVVLTKQTYKSYIIVAIGVVESILFHLNLSTGGNEKNLSKLLAALESSSSLGSDMTIYEDLQKFRKLRNKIHIYELRDDLGTDYMSFNEVEFLQMRKTLFDLMTSSSIGISAAKSISLQFLSRDLHAVEI